jgi:hypothetical protein
MIGERESFDEKEARVKVKIIGSHGRVREMDKRKCGKPSCMGDNFPRKSHNSNHGFIKWLCVSLERIAR